MWWCLGACGIRKRQERKRHQTPAGVFNGGFEVHKNYQETSRLMGSGGLFVGSCRGSFSPSIRRWGRSMLGVFVWEIGFTIEWPE